MNRRVFIGTLVGAGAALVAPRILMSIADTYASDKVNIRLTLKDGSQHDFTDVPVVLEQTITSYLWHVPDCVYTADRSVVVDGVYVWTHIAGREQGVIVTPGYTYALTPGDSLTIKGLNLSYSAA